MKKASLEEAKRVIGIMLSMGIVKLPNRKMYLSPGTNVNEQMIPFKGRSRLKR